MIEIQIQDHDSVADPDPDPSPVTVERLLAWFSLTPSRGRLQVRMWPGDVMT